jgi:hypothetical protein
MAATPGDEWIDRLARLYREHPAWIAAARHLDSSASSTVYFSHRPGESWHLQQVGDETRLSPGAAPDPDLVFRFTPASIERLEAVQGAIGDFAVALFELIVADEVKLRIAASFARLVRRGYVKLLLIAGPPVLAFGAAHGVRTARALRRVVAQVRSRLPLDWET